MRAYLEETAVDPDSLTPTFAAMVVFVDNWRWQGVPFFIASGKALARKLTEIVIYFRQVPHSMFLGTLGEEISPNRLIIGIYPDEKINLTFEVKNPGARVCLRSVIMDFSYDANYSGPKLDAYQKALLDCIQGDQMLFWREDAVERCWAFLDPVLLHCETCYDRQKRLLPYEGGSWGPGGARLGTLYAAGR
jgi:glucose-6-phosphate 1-dehydrogenase